MCWRWEVSLGFVLFQLISFVYLWRRNKYIDRWYIMLCAPFMGQEVTQFFQWAWGDIENATYTECSQFNQAWSKVLVPIAYSIALVITVFAYKTSQYTKKENPKVTILWKSLLILDVIMYPILSILLMLDKECVVKGKHGHQDWSAIFHPAILDNLIGYGGTRAIIMIYYYPPILLVGIFYQPLWLAIFPAVYSVISLVAMIIVIGPEAWSVWCWSCAIITLWGFAYVPISHWMIKTYKKEDLKEKSVDRVFGDNCCSRCLFRNSHAHMARFGLLKARAGAGSSSEKEMLSMNINDDL
eukprot:856869_1